MRLERFKIENLIPSSFFGVGLPVLIPPDATTINTPSGTKVDGQKSSITQGDAVGSILQNTRVKSSIRELNTTSLLGYAFTMPVGFKINGTLIQLPWEPIVSIDSSKIIKETPLAGNTRRGSVIEVINSTNYEINIAGHCYDNTHSGYPSAQVELLKTLDNYAGSIEIISELTDIFEITNVVIKKLSLPAMQGKPFVQNFTMQLISDEDFLLIQD